MQVLVSLQVYDALPPESRTAHAMLILPDKPAEVRSLFCTPLWTTHMYGQQKRKQ